MHTYNFYSPSDHQLTAQIRAISPRIASNVYRLCATRGQVVPLPNFLVGNGLEVLYFNSRAVPEYYQAIMETSD